MHGRRCSSVLRDIGRRRERQRHVLRQQSANSTHRTRLCLIPCFRCSRRRDCQSPRGRRPDPRSDEQARHCYPVARAPVRCPAEHSAVVVPQASNTRPRRPLWVQAGRGKQNLSGGKGRWGIEQRAAAAYRHPDFPALLARLRLPCLHPGSAALAQAFWRRVSVPPVPEVGLLRWATGAGALWVAQARAEEQGSRLPARFHFWPLRNSCGPLFLAWERAF